MPTKLDLYNKPMTLSQEFAYQHVGGDPVVVAEIQGGAGPISGQQTLKEGDVVDSVNHLTAYTLGEAQLLQFSHEEEVPGAEKATPKPKAKSKAKKK